MNVTCKNQALFHSPTIRLYHKEDKPAFDRLNRAWLDQYFRVEPIDETVFADPYSYIIASGGQIFIAELEGEIVGVGSLIKCDEKTYELSKMGVNESIRGKGIGRTLMEAAFDWAMKQQATRLIIYSNTKLAPAIGLYKKMGFIEIPLSQEARERYERCDIMLELLI